jgi:hypothetical protein
MTKIIDHEQVPLWQRMGWSRPTKKRKKESKMPAKTPKTGLNVVSLNDNQRAALTTLQKTGVLPFTSFDKRTLNSLSKKALVRFGAKETVAITAAGKKALL